MEALPCLFVIEISCQGLSICFSLRFCSDTAYPITIFPFTGDERDYVLEVANGLAAACSRRAVARVGPLSIPTDQAQGDDGVRRLVIAARPVRRYAVASAWGVAISSGSPTAGATGTELGK